MRKLTIFWRTFIVTTCTIFVSMVGALLVFGLLTTTVYRNQAMKQMEVDLERTLSHLSVAGIDENYLLDLSLQGYTVFVTGPEGLVYPNGMEEAVSLQISPLGEIVETEAEVREKESSYFELTKVNEQPASSEIEPIDVVSIADIEASESGIVLVQANNVEMYVIRGSFARDSDEYQVELFLNSGMKSNMVEAFRTVFPSVALTGLIVSLGASTIFARYLSRKIKRLSHLAVQMGRQELPVLYTPRAGDELQSLENHLYQMYGELIDTLQTLDSENIYIKKLEEDKRFFMRGATHELKTPIMMMNIVLEELIEGSDVTEEVVAKLQTCYASLQTMTKLVNEILSLSELEQVQVMDCIDVLPIIHTLLQTYRYGVDDRNLEVVIDCTVEQAYMPIAYKYAQTVFSNLIGNAVKYTPEKGRILLTVTAKHIIIANESVYYMPEELQKLTDPFVSGKQVDELEFKSHGLGLYIVDEVLKRCHIAYTVSMEKDAEYFQFIIMLPQEPGEDEVLQTGEA